MSHRTHQVGGGLRLRRGRLPRALGAGVYRKCDSFSDFWKAYVAVLLEETHRSVDKGDRAHGALVQNPVPVLRASSARPSPSPRKTGGTKPGWPHWFIVECNLSCSE